MRNVLIIAVVFSAIYVNTIHGKNDATKIVFELPDEVLSRSDSLFDCRNKDQSMGKCTWIDECPVKDQTVLRNLFVCEWKEMTPRICCPPEFLKKSTSEKDTKPETGTLENGSDALPKPTISDEVPKAPVTDEIPKESVADELPKELANSVDP